MFQFKLTKATKLGGFDQKYGQRYWCEAEDVDMPICFNSMIQDIGDFDVVGAEEKSTKLSAKGTEYIILRKVRVIKGSQSTTQAVEAPKPSQMATDIAMQLDRIERLLKDVYRAVTEDTVVEPSDAQLRGEPIDLDEIPF